MGLAPKTQFVRRGDAHLAYQVFGDGPANLLYISGAASHLEQMWEFPLFARFNEQLAYLGRVAVYDLRGFGMSDPLPTGGYSLRELAEDALAVMDAAGFDRAVLWADVFGPAVAVWLAVHFPDRVAGLVLDNGSARFRAHPGYDIGFSDVELAERRDAFASMWGTGVTFPLLASVFVEDERFREDWARYERLAATPTSLLRMYDLCLTFDVRDLLEQVKVPTLVCHSTTNTLVPIAHGRYLTEHIDGARGLETDGDWVVAWRDAVGEIAEFLTGDRSSVRVERSLLVVLFTDIAASTARAASMGDTEWGDLLGQFQTLVRKVLDRYGASEVNTLGDAVFVVATSPSIAIDVARAIRTGAADLGLEVRTGLHLGEVEHQGDDYAGLAVHIGARIVALADPGEILVSQTVRDTLAGSPIELTDRGAHGLKGVPGEWQVYAVVD